MSQSFGAKKMTQTQIAVAKKEQFLKNVAQVSQFCLGDFLQRCGYNVKTITYVTSSDFGLNSSDFFKISENSASFDRLIEIQKEIGTEIQKINFSGALSAKRRERLTDLVFEIDEILSKAHAEMNPDETILQIIAQNRQKSYEDIKDEWNKAVMSPLKKIIFGIAFGIGGFLAFTGAMALVSNRASLLEFIAVFILFFMPLVATFILYKKQTAKPKI
ncbi:MAG: hypothetical protein ACFN38_05335 [Campylobacter sp.]